MKPSLPSATSPFSIENVNVSAIIVALDVLSGSMILRDTSTFAVDAALNSPPALSIKSLMVVFSANLYAPGLATNP